MKLTDNYEAIENDEHDQKWYSSLELLVKLLLQNLFPKSLVQSKWADEVKACDVGLLSILTQSAPV